MPHRFKNALSHWGILVIMTVLSGHVIDRTTGQPLAGVDIRARGAAKIAPVRTNDAGHYTLRGLTPGRYTISVSSDDVPPQTFQTVVGNEKNQSFNITACSVTLDYSCAAAMP